jgi:hypothetical protein
MKIASKHFKHKSIYKTTELTTNFCPSLCQESKDNITTFKGNKGTQIGMQFKVHFRKQSCKTASQENNVMFLANAAFDMPWLPVL